MTNHLLIRRSKFTSLILFASIVVFASCSPNEFDSTSYAKKYCECLNKENVESNFFDARVKCDGELLSSNKYFRFYYIESYYGRYAFMFSESFRDSVAEFNLQFNRYIEKNCCKIAIEGCDEKDSMQIKRKLLDSISYK